MMIRRIVRAILWAAAVAAASAACARYLPSFSSLSSLALNEKYAWLDVATWCVIVGVIIEELPFLRDVMKFAVASVAQGFWAAFLRALSHWRKGVESVGFVLLVIGLVYESKLQTLIRRDEADIHVKDEKQIAEAIDKGNILMKRAAHRLPSTWKMIPVLKKAPASVEIRYAAEDMESAEAVRLLKIAFDKSGWTVSEAVALPVAGLLKEGVSSTSWWSVRTHPDPSFSDQELAGHQIGLSDTASIDDVKAPLTSLIAALLRGMGAPSIVTDIDEDPSIPEGHFRLYLLPK